MAAKITVEEVIGRFNGLDSKIRLGIFSVLLILLAAVDYFAVMQFELKALSSTSGQITKHNEDIIKLQADQARLGQIKSSLQKTKDDFSKMQGKVRPMQDLPVILEDLSKMAADARLQVDQITPSREGQEDFANVGGVKYFALPVVVMAHCGYHNFAQFLNRLENSNLLFLLKDLRMEGNEKQNSTVAVTATLKLIVAEKPLEVGK